ncbi:MAG: NUDIX domain-containing protein [Duncaniella sp.]|nr:NUDIX domain-containing protein [Duncaniella sp.]
MIANGSDNPRELLPVVDEEGNIIGTALRSECHSGVTRPLHPVVHLHIFDAEGRLWLQKRPDWKDIQPGKWDTAVGGHIDPGESVEQALRREALEEAGIEGFDPRPLGTYIFESPRERELVHSFATLWTRPVCPSAETDGGRFWTRSEILDAIGRGILTPNFEKEYREIVVNGEL